MAKVLPPLVGRALRSLRRLHPHCSPSYAQEGEDRVLARLLDGRTQGFYVDVGAHHPTRFSNTCFFYHQGWHGINIEPAPDAVVAFRRERPRDINLQLGIAEEPGTLTYYIFDDPALNTFDKALRLDRETNTPYRVVSTIPVPVQRLDEVLSKSLPARQPIDFMSIDVEGLDLQALRSNDWQTFRPRYVLVEALEFKLEQAVGHPTHAYMGSIGYELVAKTLNTLFYRDRR